ncbi:MAG TPA: FAD-dependent oxidoreductase [Candidatus Dormibacteraeota bacterium]|nr:FAD-dependent oxidoreductase [Candidatus Dormibacteraeota bacterium]
MTQRRYVVIGNGVAGQTCAEELRKVDPDSSIVMIAGERHPLYNRVALPRYLAGKMKEEKVLMRSVEDYNRQKLEIFFETLVTGIDVANRKVHTNRGQEFAYDALLVATGGRPKPPPWPGADLVRHTHAFQTLDDTNAIIERAVESKRILVMGGSFISYELAEGLTHRAKDVTWIMRGPWFLRYVLDEEGGALCRHLGEKAGVRFLCSDEVTQFSASDGGYLAETQSGQTVEFDTLLYGVGLDYYLEPVLGTGIEVKGGILTDSKLQTNIPDIYAAGDIAVFQDLMIGRHNQMGTWDNAIGHGLVAAHNMAGAREDYFDVPTYTTTMFGSTLAAMGITPDVMPNLESVRDYSIEGGYYRKLFFLDDRLVGAIMIGPPKGRKKLIEIMRSRERIERPREELLDPTNL